jgi:hypothetical protein
MLKNKLTLSIAGGAMALVGMIGGTALMASAQSTPAVVTTTTAAASAVDTPESATDQADTTSGTDTHGHAPLGGDGVVASITGTTIVIGEEANEGNASYTIDASKAIVTNNGVAGTLSDIKVGTKIFVQGVTTGTNVAATSISIGHPGNHADKADGTEGADSSGANDPADAAGSSDASGQ